MKVTKHIELGSWLVPRVEAARAATPAGTVGTGFEAYLRILHPVLASCDTPTRADQFEEKCDDGETWWPWAEVARRNNRKMHPLVQWHKLSDDDDQDSLSFPDGRSVARPPECCLEPDLLARLVGHIYTLTRSAESVTAAVWNGFGALNYPDALPVDNVYWEGLGVDIGDQDSDGDVVYLVSRQVAEAVKSGPYLELPGRKYVLLSTSLTELSDFRWVYSAGLGWGSSFPGVLPQLFWPVNHEWVIGGDVDFDFTIVGGSYDLIHSIHSDMKFESYIVKAGDDLTQWGDVVNH